jgi:hypothetical protein
VHHQCQTLKINSNRFEKKEEISGRNREVWEERSLEGFFFFITQNPPNLVELKNRIGWRFGGFICHSLKKYFLKKCKFFL